MLRLHPPALTASAEALIMLPALAPTLCTPVLGNEALALRSLTVQV